MIRNVAEFALIGAVWFIAQALIQRSHLPNQWIFLLSDFISLKESIRA